MMYVASCVCTCARVFLVAAAVADVVPVVVLVGALMLMSAARNVIATAATNGVVLVWDTERVGQSHRVTVGT